MEDDTWAAARMSVMLEQRYGDPAEATRLAQLCIEHLGGDPTLERVAHGPPAASGP